MTVLAHGIRSNCIQIHMVQLELISTAAQGAMREGIKSRRAIVPRATTASQKQSFCGTVKSHADSIAAFIAAATPYIAKIPNHTGLLQRADTQRAHVRQRIQIVDGAATRRYKANVGKRCAGIDDGKQRLL